jgi:hypothetical protein
VFAHTEKHRRLFRALSADSTGFAIQRTWHKILLDLVREDVKAGFPNTAQYRLKHWSVSSPAHSMALFSGGSRVQRLSAREIDAIFRSLTMPVVRIAAQSPSPTE